ncbi:MAG: phage tail tape measure protein [Pseudolabrys sp.]|nr:phage tail tape measure protein [Pseudolabrys sp.]
MARTILDAEARITARDRTGGVFDGIANKIRRVNGAANAANRQMGTIERASAAVSRSTGAIVAASTRMLAPLAAGYGISQGVKRFGETEMAITRIGITADATDAEVGHLHKTLRGLAFEAGKPFDEVTGGLEQLVAGGLDLPQAMPAMPAIVKTAQAAGAEVRDMANTSLALIQNMGIAGAKMQDAFDILVAGGKAGKFELKDMARYLPSIMPQAVAVGMKGEDGLKRIVALLQAVRAGTGTTEEAASSVANIFAKMESEETAKRFSKFGIDLRKEMAQARKEGKDLLEVFTGLSKKAVNGDLSKLPQLFSDMEFARGMRALMSFGDLLTEVMGKLNSARGSAGRDFDRVMTKSQVSINRLSESWDRATESIGRLIDRLGGSKFLNGIAKTVESTIDSIDRLGDPKKSEEFRRERGQPQTASELHDRLLQQKKREQLADLDSKVAVAEHDVAAAEATAKLRRGLGRDPGDARRNLERLRIERESVRLQIEALKIPYPLPIDLKQFAEKKGGHVVEPSSRKLRPGEADSIKKELISAGDVLHPVVRPMPRPDPRRQPSTPIFVNGLDLPPQPIEARALPKPPDLPPQPTEARALPKLPDLPPQPTEARALPKPPDLPPQPTEARALPKLPDLPPIAEPQLRGSAEITNKIVVEPSPDFITRVIQSVRSAIPGLSVRDGTTGSTGGSMPEADPGRNY